MSDVELRKKIRELFRFDQDAGVFYRRSTKEKACKIDKHGYAYITVGTKRYKSHRMAWLVVYGELPEFLDHINGIRFDNRIENLRPATRAENMRNAKKKHGNNPFKGVQKRGNSYRAEITVDQKKINIGTYQDPVLAAERYDEAALQYHGDFANINFPEKRDQYLKTIAIKKQTSNAVMKMYEALKFIIDREDFSFAECSEAELIFSKAKEAIAEFEKDTGE